jgi:hypothetical protein
MFGRHWWGTKTRGGNLMAQQVNLFNTLARPSKYYLTEQLILQIFLGFILFLVLLTCVQIFLLQKEKYKLKILQATYLSRQAAFENLSRLSGEVEKTSTEIQKKTMLLQTLQERKVTSGKCALLSNYFTALSEMPVSGLWFNQININLVEDKIALSGSTYTPTLLIQLVENLNKTACFADRDFGPLKLDKKDIKTPTSTNETSTNSILDFSMRSKEPVSLTERLA